MGERGTLSTVPRADALGDFVATTRRWTGVQIELAPEVSAVCRTVAVANLATCGWAMVVLGMRWPCTGFLCTATTFGGRPALLLGWTIACALAAVILSVSTHGMVRVGAGQMAALVLTTLLGAIAALGAAVVLVLAALVVTASVNALLIVIEHI